MGEDIFQSRAIDKAFEEESKRRGFVEAIERDDVGVLKFSEGTGFTFEAFKNNGIFSEVSVKDLHCEGDVSFEVPDAEDRAHSTGGDERVHPELFCDDLTYNVRRHLLSSTPRMK